ncbi:hypothetical protein OG413_14115 [Streptomyces sp. NBC_01433]|uniref:hypothetical protein n=1 Tax=Streptomyces sp. NBC_01433 TaxID=2903864 RepID=UPI00224F4E54|nr:hypothetical protein [Streptomyces sp. NBC_01433]MCX4676425.1 hypothetical protein [Streptomyces sp. NBC_01433]
MRAAALAITAVATVALVTGCSSTPGEDLEDWYTSGGEKQIEQMREDASRVNEVSMGTFNQMGPACEDLLKHLPAAEDLDAIPDEPAQITWKAALKGLRKGATECKAGVGSEDGAKASRGIMTVQLDGLPNLRDTVSRIKDKLASD